MFDIIQHDLLACGKISCGFPQFDCQSKTIFPCSVLGTDVDGLFCVELNLKKPNLPRLHYVCFKKKLIFRILQRVIFCIQIWKLLLV